MSLAILKIMSSTNRFNLISFGEREVRVEIIRSARARRLTLRADAVKGVVRATTPWRMRIGDAEKFIAEHHGWIAARVAGWPTPLAFDNGAKLPFDGATLMLNWSPDYPRGVRRQGDYLIIGGPPATVPGRTLRWLRAAALADLAPATLDLAARIGRRATRVTVRDPASRWGSCTSNGAIGYSWRLILAPPLVRQSVVAHEVAHLVHPNHGRDFWALAESLTDGELRAARDWLKTNGAALHWVGRST